MRCPFRQLNSESRGQAMIETALMLPFLLEVVFNTINFGYFFLIATNLAAAPRSAALYSIMGPSTPSTPELPAPGPATTVTTVSYLALADLTGAISGATSTPVQVCTADSGTTGSGASLLTVCTQYNSSSTYTPDADPEAPSFVLNRVDVTYTFKPILDQRIFNLILLATPVCTGSGGGVTCTFHRFVEMRAMN